MFLLFKKHVLCQHVNLKEYLEIHKLMDDPRSLKSHLALNLYSHSDFQEGRTKLQSISNGSHEENLNFIGKISEHERFNQTIKLPEDFVPESIIFSNNDLFLGLVGGETLFIINSKDGKIVHEMSIFKDANGPDKTISVSGTLESEETSYANEGGHDEQKNSPMKGDRPAAGVGYGSISSASATAPTKNSVTHGVASKNVQSNFQSLAPSTIFTPQDSEIIQGGSSIESANHQSKMETLERNFIK